MMKALLGWIFFASLIIKIPCVAIALSIANQLERAFQVDSRNRDEWLIT